MATSTRPRGGHRCSPLSVADGHVLAGGRFRAAGPVDQRLADLGLRSARLTPFVPRPSVAGSVEASFAQTSTAAGRAIRLLVRPPVGALTMQFVRSGVPVSGAARIACAPSSDSALSLSVTAPRAPSGFYLARLQAGRRTGFAPLILRPSGADTARVAIVLPTNTWQAYNRREDDGDGVGDTWYACHTASCWSAVSARGVDATRPFLDHGLPRDSLRFLAWVDGQHLQADVLGDDDLNRIHSAAALARRYALLVFPGHTEYVTAREFDLIESYRDDGGNLAFLSANNLFRLVERVGTRLRLVARFRDLGRPEAAIEGEQYLDWNHGVYPNEPYTVTDAASVPWLFAGTGLHDGSHFGRFGIEIDARAASSPPGTYVLAAIPDIFGPGETAEMTYYETRSGGKVFSAGVLNFAGSVENRPMSRLMANLWAHLSAPERHPGPAPNSLSTSASSEPGAAGAVLGPGSTSPDPRRKAAPAGATAGVPRLRVCRSRSAMGPSTWSSASTTRSDTPTGDRVPASSSCNRRATRGSAAALRPSAAVSRSTTVRRRSPRRVCSSTSSRDQVGGSRDASDAMASSSAADGGGGGFSSR